MIYDTTYNIAWQREQVNDIVFIRDYSTDEFVILEDVAKDIWMGIVAKKTIEEISNDLLNIYSDIELSDALTDVTEFVETCIQNGWLM